MLCSSMQGGLSFRVAFERQVKMPFRMFLHLKDVAGQNKKKPGLAVNLSSVGASPKEAVVPTASEQIRPCLY